MQSSQAQSLLLESASSNLHSCHGQQSNRLRARLLVTHIGPVTRTGHENQNPHDTVGHSVRVRTARHTPVVRVDSGRCLQSCAVPTVYGAAISRLSREACSTAYLREHASYAWRSSTHKCRTDLAKRLLLVPVAGFPASLSCELLGALSVSAFANLLPRGAGCLAILCLAWRWLVCLAVFVWVCVLGYVRSALLAWLRWLDCLCL